MNLILNTVSLEIKAVQYGMSYICSRLTQPTYKELLLFKIKNIEL